MKAANSDAEPLPGRQREQLPDRKRQAPKGMSGTNDTFRPTLERVRRSTQAE
jgi:hypothetical protein